MENFSQRRFHIFFIVIITSLLTFGCSSSAELLNQIPVHTVNFKVVNQDDNPVAGAAVEASNGESATTDSTGMASLEFGSVGVHEIKITSSEFGTTTKTISLPRDKGETVTTHLSKSTQFTGQAGGRLGFGQMQMNQLYPMFFNYLFNSHGYSLSITDYAEGEWTKWRIQTGGDSGDQMHLKKAFLKKKDNGQEWWQIQLFEENSEKAAYTAEILFSDERSSVRRYREQFEDNEPQEKPVREGWYSDPADLTEESIEGATTKRNIDIEVPSGAFTADLVEFGVGPGLFLKIWKSTEVPGGTVQYLTTQEEGEDKESVYRSELIDYGSDAKTLLNSY